MQYIELPENTNISGKSEENSFFRYAMLIEYIGSSFAGSQIQPNQRTVQSELENALNILTKMHVRTIFAGRTDAGVHARGQVVHFDLPFKVKERRFIYAMNSILPSDVCVAGLQIVDKNFHSQKSAIFRWYRYQINNKPYRSAFMNETSVHIHLKLDIDKMNQALSLLVGKHDFSSFRRVKTNNPARECIVTKAICSADKDGIISIDIVANRFLYNMVRIIVGTLLEIGAGTAPVEYIKDVLEAKDRRKAGPTARPEGLTLMQVSYEEKYNLFDVLNKEASQDENILCKAS